MSTCGSTSKAFASLRTVLICGSTRFLSMIMDNLQAPKTERVRELIEARGCELLYLPPYSPDLNPIEEAFSKIKGILRQTGARARKTLVEAIGKALDTVSAKDARDFFAHCGIYPALGQ